MQLPGTLLDTSSKNHKNPLWKKFFICRGMELSDSKIKRLLIFSQKRAFLIFLEMDFSAQSWKIKNIYPEKISYILILKNSLYFLKRKLFLYFGKRKPRKSSLYFRQRNFFNLQEELSKPQKIKFLIFFQKNLWIKFSKNTSIFSINWIKQYCWCIKKLKAFYCVEPFFSF